MFCRLPVALVVKAEAVLAAVLLAPAGANLLILLAHDLLQIIIHGCCINVVHKGGSLLPGLAGWEMAGQACWQQDTCGKRLLT